MISKNTKNKNFKISEKTRVFYNAWKRHFPDDNSQTTWELFYLFINTLPKNKDRYWLESLFKKDRINITEDKIEEYCNIYEHIKNCRNVYKTNTAKLFIKNISN